MNTIQHASIKMLYENQETIIFFFYIWYLFLVTFKLYKKNDLYIKTNKNYNIL